MHGVAPLLAFAAVTALSWLSVYGTRSVAVRLNILDVPNERSSHTRPMPLCGGGAIVVISLAGLALLAVVHPITSRNHLLVFGAGALLIALVSLVDDLRHVPYGIRLAVHTLAAAVFIVGYSYWHAVDLPLVGTIALGGVGIVATAVWMIGLTNAFNFMDGVDGMAAGQAVVAGLGWAILGFLRGWALLEVTGLLLAATSLGFLLHNWHPARIFMGDVGSTFLGYCFAALAVVAARYDARLALAGTLLVWPTLFDTGFTVLNRLRRRENVFVGHREFLFHRLVAAGWTHAQAATLYLAFPILGAVLAFTWDRGTPVLHGTVVLVIAALCLALWLLVRHQEQRAARTDVLPGTANRPRLTLVEIRGPVPAVGGEAVHTSPWSSFRSHLPRQASDADSGGTWDGVERRSGRDRRSGQDRRQRGQSSPDRRSGWGRRATDFPLPAPLPAAL
jgi:UDP-N-acetylmuramyl pentapeptide phosphotransferase/UDP-N-acetylglucosamine-1-phosphate transferase